ncbi:RagB/SusD family nutrient uptake outer membrane protein [Sphingobacterium psychroaquaticum]|uniref:Starch-binding associating with outer membrane n=1 Tax=Sphingobacterium psychroaquaticum TaxID=561061 RepID=A0A1X7JSB7_9SPHI|nr:RagB/SusD family nutrient uptake outer membrane protein [Sphingobacterium psychroaquaticum]SMG30668.1 Starch-binding associating with outer membrane [Sphingobacterium psychroaquaticum]
MKKLFFLYITIGLCLQGCDKNYLDRDPESTISPEASFKTVKDLELFTKSFYEVLPSAEGVYNESVDNIVKNTLDDELTGKRQVPVNGGGWTWTNLRNINFFLGNATNTLSAATAAPYIAEARFFRAYFYFDKLKRFGDVPWYNTVLNPDDEELLKKKRDPRTLIVDSIMQDLDFAIKNLETKASDEKVTKWTALALKSRIALFEGTFRKYHTNLTLPNAKELLEKAAEAAKQVIDGKQYSIYMGAGDNSYGALFYSVNSLPQEIILARKFSDALQIWHNVNYYTITASYGKPGLDKHFVNSYLMKDGSRFTDKANYQTMTFLQEIKDRDPRLSQTIRTPGYKRIGGAATLAPNFGNSVTGYQLIKYVGDPKYDNFNRSENDMPVFRYAEVLLNYAEARAELGELTQEDINISIKPLRDRAGMPNMDLAAAKASVDAFMANDYPLVTGAFQGPILEIRRERRIELVMESFRWDDILRWKAGKLVTKQFKGMYFPGIGKYDLDGDGKDDVWIYEDTKPTATGIQLLKLGSEILLEEGKKGNVVVNSHIKKAFDESKDYLYPIPIDQLELNPNLEQNPNWK